MSHDALGGTRTRRARPRKSLGVAAAAYAVVAAVAFPAFAETYAVGPGRPIATLDAVARRLRPGDIVEVDGDAAYPGDIVFRESGTAASPILVRGRRVNGKRPILRGGASTVEFRADHYVFEGFEVTGGEARCVYHHGDDLTIRDTVVHDCERHGILGADSDSGSLLLDYVEVFASGRGDQSHQIYVATDEQAHPGSVFRMRHCYVHDGKGGNNVKSRAERNELHYNWIEGAKFHEVELVGPAEAPPERAREDSEVAGNVIRKTGAGYAIRVGGDGTGETNGRYRFLNDTILVGPDTTAAIRVYNGIESLEVNNTVFAREGGGPVWVVREQDVRWAKGAPRIAGTNNWVPVKSTGVPGEWRNTRIGVDPGFLSPRDFRPASGSALIDAGTLALPVFADAPFPAPLAEPIALPPLAHLEAPYAALPRRVVGAIDIGAFEHGLDVNGNGAASSPAAAAAEPAVSPAVPSVKKSAVGGACGCRSAVADRRPGVGGAALLGVAAWVLRRKRREPHCR